MDQGIGSWPRRRARMEPDAIALIQQDRRVDYATLADRVDALAAALADLGVGPGDRVAYLGNNDIATFETLFATMHLGAIFVALNTRLAAPEIAGLLDDADPTVFVVGADTGIDALARSSATPQLLHLGKEYENAITDHTGRTPPAHAVGLDDPALILYTSGTTGRPKGAVLTHGNIVWNTLNQFAHFSLGRDDVSLCSAPLFHVLGLGQITLPTLYAGGTVVVIPKFEPAEFLATIERRRATAFPLAPTMLKMLCEAPEWETTDLSSVRCVAFGGSPVLEHVAKAWLARGIQALQGYGMTEAAPGVLMALRHGADAHPVSAGVPHFFTDVALLTPTGEIIEGPGQGELLVKGPNVFAGYWNRPDATEQAFIDGWFRTGDIVRIDDDGWAHIVDRVKDMIISGGENIYPVEVEAAISRLDGVGDCAVVAVPDERWGEVGLAFIVVRAGHEIDEDAIRTHLEANLARYKIPKYYVFREQLPRNALGKLQRLLLRDHARQMRGLTP
ncbi:long-chain fatty acid--CoA ligase [Nocardia vinacea]|uniref:Long-chain fatty acid--CoA ligase n=1 Tax=Nocardia vinacea TaxID=96468 RepID=A0ABZ1YM01_9NOCA|nr:long-chain fatty acid--CoA ligase [Nocardia vinacea]